MPTGNLIPLPEAPQQGHGPCLRGPFGRDDMRVHRMHGRLHPDRGSQLLRPSLPPRSPSRQSHGSSSGTLRSRTGAGQKAGPLGHQGRQHIAKLCYQPGTALDKQRYRPLHNRHSRCSRGTQEQDGHEVQEDNQECRHGASGRGRTYCSPQTPAYSHRRGYRRRVHRTHLQRASYEGWGIWFLGGLEVAEAAASKLAEKYPGLNVAGTRNGYFRDEEIDDICSDIRRSGARSSSSGSAFRSRNTGSRTILQRPERQSAWA